MITLINPNIHSQCSDPFTTGIPFLPIGLASVAGNLLKVGEKVTLVDAFGEDPYKVRKVGRFIIQGLTPDDVRKRIPTNTEYFVFYAGILASHASLVTLIRHLKCHFPQTPFIVLENTQAVTSYSLASVKEDFFLAGVDYLITGESEERLPQLIDALRKDSASQIPSGVFFRKQGSDGGVPPNGFIVNLDILPFPAWELFPLHNYWSLNYSHGPFSGPFLPLLTSRGCPYPCRFCVIPATNNRQWRSQSPTRVVDEMAHWVKQLGVREFHWEDVNPTINENRIRDISEMIIQRSIAIQWKIAAGTKLESLKNPETIQRMAQSGCRYISFSPESGSQAILKSIDKPFNFEHAEHMVQVMDEHGIKSQACFVLGFPGETDSDRAQTTTAIRRLVQRGLDEIALFIITPVPGSAIFNLFKGFESLSQLNFSPSWRSDYSALNRCRLKMYCLFLIWKLQYRPLKTLLQPTHFLRRRFHTKMEMTPFRALKLMWRGLWAKEAIQ